MSTTQIILAALTGLAFAITLVLLLAFLSKRNRERHLEPFTDGEKHERPPSGLRKALGILLGFSIVLTLALGGGLSWLLISEPVTEQVAEQEEIEPTEEPTPTPQITIQPADTDEILVIISTFEDRSNGGYQGDDLAEEIIGKINNSLPTEDTAIRVELYPVSLTSAEDAAELLAESGGLLLVYGWVDEDGIESYFENNMLLFEELLDLPSGAWRSEEHFYLQYTTEISDQVNFIANYILGMLHALVDNDRSALVFFAIANGIDSICADPDVGKFVYLWLGYVHYSLSEYTQAIADNDQALELDPRFSWAYTNRGIAHCALEEYQEGIEDFNSVLALLPDDALTYAYRGLAYSQLGDYQLALDDYAVAIELDPDYGLTYGYRGITHDDMGAFELAISDYNTAIELDPDSAFFYAYRGNTYYDLGDLPQSIDDFSTAIDLDEDYLWAYASRGLAYYYQGLYQLAISDFNRSLELDPEYVWSYGIRGLTYHDLGEYDKAISDYTRAVELDPEYAWAYASRGWTYYTIGEIENAIADLGTAIELIPDYAWAYWTRGYILENTDRYKEAIGDYQMAVKLNPEAYGNLCETYEEVVCP